MRYFLSEQCRRVAVRLAAEKTLCAFDYDGTLAPIVAHPASARMRAGTSRLLARVAALYPCAVISGRARRDLHERLAGTGVKRVIGNHGAEAESHADAGRPEVERWLTALAPAIAPL
ncbi:MAG TPA: trehalose-phosphatase, partial [Candidatus Sulfopaludibacter sp.]|nr:trehalose-phosphatase [Candidatus Sulfopaludibacter sp.]